MLVALQFVGDADQPLKETVLEPCEEPKFVPEMAMIAPTGPKFGDSAEMLGVATTVKGFPLLSTPLACTTTFPVVAAAGTVA